MKEQIDNPYELTLFSETSIRTLAAERGCTVRFPKENELFIDLDSTHEVARFTDLFGIFQQRNPNAVVRFRKSPSGKIGHIHAIVNIGRPVADELERVFLQSLLGSDPKRELLAYLKLQQSGGNCVSSVLFEKKFEKKEVDNDLPF